MPKDEYSIVITTQAKLELQGMLDYITDVFFADGTVAKMRRQIYDSIDVLKTFPHSASLMQETEYKKLGIRRLTVKNYSVFYLVNEEKRQVEIVHILHGMQDYTQKL